ncbi:hypothetical protein V6N13_014768 [Hibiscus sabdariffa]
MGNLKSQQDEETKGLELSVFDQIWERSFANPGSSFTLSSLAGISDNGRPLSIYPKGNNVNHLSIYLDVAESATLPSGWTRLAQYGFAVIDRIPLRKAIELEEPTEEDMKTFFSALESKLLSSKIIVSQEAVKEALAKLDEAMNITPLKAVEDKNYLSEKESIKLTITHSLDSNVVRYKEVESEVKQVDQKFASFHEQVEEAEKERENMLAEQKGMFRSLKKMQMEIEALETKWSEYEAKAKAAGKEAKTVEAEWGIIKDFISSIKGKI